MTLPKFDVRVRPWFCGRRLLVGHIAFWGDARADVGTPYAYKRQAFTFVHSRLIVEWNKDETPDGEVARDIMAALGKSSIEFALSDGQQVQFTMSPASAVSAA